MNIWNESLKRWLRDVHIVAFCSTGNLKTSIKFSRLKLILNILNLSLLKFCLKTVGTHFLPFQKIKLMRPFCCT